LYPPPPPALPFRRDSPPSKETDCGLTLTGKEGEVLPYSPERHGLLFLLRDGRICPREDGDVRDSEWREERRERLGRTHGHLRRDSPRFFLGGHVG
jgi:hypothetical protein